MREFRIEVDRLALLDVPLAQKLVHALPRSTWHALARRKRVKRRQRLHRGGHVLFDGHHIVGLGLCGLLEPLALGVGLGLALVLLGVEGHLALLALAHLGLEPLQRRQDGLARRQVVHLEGLQRGAVQLEQLAAVHLARLEAARVLAVLAAVDELQPLRHLRHRPQLDRLGRQPAHRRDVQAVLAVATRQPPRRRRSSALMPAAAAAAAAALGGRLVRHGLASAQPVLLLLLLFLIFLPDGHLERDGGGAGIWDVIDVDDGVVVEVCVFVYNIMCPAKSPKVRSVGVELIELRLLSEAHDSELESSPNSVERSDREETTEDTGEKERVPLGEEGCE